MDFYEKAFGARDCGRHFMPDGKSLMHGLMKIGDSFFMLAGEFPPHCLSPKSRGGTSVTMSLYVEDVDTLFDRAAKAGCKVIMPVMDQFWGTATVCSKTPLATPGPWPPTNTIIRQSKWPLWPKKPSPSSLAGSPN